MDDGRYAEEPQFKPLAGIAKKSEYAIYANVGIGLAGVPVMLGFVDHSHLSDPGMVTRGLFASVVYAGHLLTYVVGGIFFLMWMYRAQINALRLVSAVPPTSRDQQTAAINVIGWWFVPIANLWKPYENLKNLWRATDPKAGPDADWRKFKVPNDMTWWWVFWIIMQFTTRFADTSLVGVLGSAAIRLITGILAIRMIKAITERQHHQIHMRDAG